MKRNGPISDIKGRSLPLKKRWHEVHDDLSNSLEHQSTERTVRNHQSWIKTNNPLHISAQFKSLEALIESKLDHYSASPEMETS